MLLIQKGMLVSKYLHPKAHHFLAVSGFISPSSSSDALVGLDILIHSVFGCTSDDQKYLLIPTILEVLYAFYPHQDVLFTLNEYMHDVYSDYDESTAESLKR